MLTTLALAVAQQTPRDLTTKFEAPPNVRVTLWAESPQLYNPTAIDVDARGRVWVAEAVNYRKWNGRNPGLDFEAGDRIVILEDTDGDGACDKSKVFVQDKDLVAPLGIACFGDKIVVSCSPTAWVYTDADGDDVPEKKEALLTGFGGHDHDHGLHSIVGGPDGRWWFSVGNAGPHIVTDKSGWTLRSGSIYTGGGEHEADNKPGLVSDDGRVWTGGLMLRVDPDGKNLSVQAHNFRNQYEVALDSFGNMFTEDNDDEVVTCRTLWVMEGGNHGFFAADGSRTWQADRRPGQSTWEAHWHVDDPGVVPPGCNNGTGGPTGVAVYEGDLLTGFEGRVLNADASASVVYAHKPVAKGAGYELEPGVLIRSRGGPGLEEEAHMFRPSDVAIGIDGSVYVADWYDPGVGGHAMADEKGYGRILRVAPNVIRTGETRADLSTLDGQISALCSPAVNVRWQALQKLAKQGEAALPALKRLSESPNPRLAARALWSLALAGNEGNAIVRRTLHEPLRGNGDVQVTAFRALRASGGDAVGLFTESIRELAALASLRREAAIAMRDVPWQRAKEPLVWSVNALNMSDRFATTALVIGTDRRQSQLFESATDRAGLDDVDWWLAVDEREGPRQLALALQPPQSIPVLKALLMKAPTLSERRQAMDALAFINTREAAEAMLDLALAGPKDMRDYAAWWVRFRDTNDWREYHIADALGDVDRRTAKLAWTSGVTKSGLHDFSVELGGAKHVLLAVGDAGDGNGYDWSDWIGAKFVGAKGEQKLRELTWLRASAAWGSVHVGKNAEGGALKVDGVEFADSIGTHAESEIVFAVPEGATKLVGKCGPDDGGTKRAGTKTSVEFQIYLDTPPDRSAFKARLETLRNANSPAQERENAALELIKDSEGALAVIELAHRGQLPNVVELKVIGPLNTHSDPAVRAMAAATFPDSRKTPSLDEILALSGDKRRGQAVFFSQAATCSQCHSIRGRGGDVGPDLSEIRKKYASRELLDHVRSPNKAIEFGYQTWVVETTDGLMYTGFLQAGNLTKPTDGTVVLKDTSGKRVSFDESEVENARLQAISVMPDNVAIGLSTQDLADLAAFLTADPNTPPKLGAPIQLFNGRDFDGWSFFTESTEAASVIPNDVWSVRDGAIHCAGRPAGYMRTNAQFTSFVLELDWRWDPAETPSNSGVLLRKTGADMIWPRSIEAQLMHRNAGDIWNIGEFPMQVDAARSDELHTTKLAPCNEKPVGEWNHYKITLNGGDLTLEVNGLVQNTARWCEEIAGSICLQSEGSAIEFKNVVMTPIED